MRILFSILFVGLTASGFYYCHTFYPGLVKIDWLGYNVTLTVSLALLSLVAIFTLLMIIIGVVRKIFSLPQLFANYKSKKLQQKSSDQLWIAFQSIQLNGQPFPEKPLKNLIKDKLVDQRIALYLIIAHKLNKHESITAYLDQLKQLPHTQAFCLYADILQLKFQGNVDEALNLYPKLIDLTESSVIKIDYATLLIQQAKVYYNYHAFDKMYELLKCCDPSFLILHDLNLYGCYSLLMSHHYNHHKQFKKSQKMIEVTWVHSQTLGLFEAYKICLQTNTLQDNFNAAKRLASFAPSALISLQIVIDSALALNAISDARIVFNQLQSYFPSHPLIQAYQDKLLTIL